MLSAAISDNWNSRTIFSRKDETVWEDSEDEDEDDDEEDDEEDEDEMDVDDEGEAEKMVIDEEEIEARRKEKAKVRYSQAPAGRPSLTFIHPTNSERRRKGRKLFLKPFQNPLLRMRRKHRSMKSPILPLIHVRSKRSANSSRAPRLHGRIFSLHSLNHQLVKSQRRSRSFEKPRSRVRKISGGHAERRLERWRTSRKKRGLVRWLIWPIWLLELAAALEVGEWGGEDEENGDQ